MRIVRIDTSADFAMFFQGFTVGGNTQKAKTMQAVRHEARILDKLDAISVPLTPEQRYPTGDVVRGLSVGPVSLRLTTEEYDLFRHYFESVPWTTTAARDVVRLADSIAAAETE